MAKNVEHIIRNGKPFVVIPEDMFERLVEDAEMLDDIRAYDEAKAARNAGEEYFPAEFVYAKMEAKTTGQLISLWMEYRHVTQTALAEAAGISRPYLSEIMSDKKPGSLIALKAIAKALRADLEDITR